MKFSECEANLDSLPSLAVPGRPLSFPGRTEPEQRLYVEPKKNGNYKISITEIMFKKQVDRSTPKISDQSYFF